MKSIALLALSLLCACAHQPSQPRTPANSAEETATKSPTYTCKIKHALDEERSDCGEVTLDDEPTPHKDSSHLKCQGQNVFLFWSRSTTPGSNSTLRFGTENRGKIVDTMTVESPEIAHPPLFHLSLDLNRSRFTRRWEILVASCTRKD